MAEDSKTVKKAPKTKKTAAKENPEKTIAEPAAPKKTPAKKSSAAVKKADAATKETKAAPKKAAPAKKKAAPVKAETAPAPKKAVADKPKKAAPKKSTKPTAAANVKAAGEQPSDYYVVRTIQKIADNATATINEYNDNLKKAMESGLDFMEDMGKGSIEALNSFVVDGKNLVAKVPFLEKLVSEAEETGKSVAHSVKSKVTPPAQKAKFMVTTVVLKASMDVEGYIKQYNEKYLKKGIEYGVDLVSDLGNVTRMTVGSLADSGKKMAQNLSVLETIQESIDAGLHSVSSRVNLPSKKDIDRLAEAVKAFNKKLEGLAKKKS
ncbi:MAG: hypothetical protein QMD09_07845 [Desulfatibacillaceae bacterium]|nr:hypothetical protein [Desulfatibacillaceae bacterium]